MPKKIEEWLRQADYDMETAQAMFDAGRPFYAVFMCHLSLEKALKGLHVAVLEEEPPRTHNILFLAQQIGLDLPESLFDFLFMLNRASVLTRYPEELEELQKQFTESRTREILAEGREMLRWLKAKLPMP